jgi:hypothetical protein
VAEWIWLRVPQEVTVKVAARLQSADGTSGAGASAPKMATHGPQHTGLSIDNVSPHHRRTGFSQGKELKKWKDESPSAFV